MANKDFFDEEYDKIESRQVKEQSEKNSDWYSRQPEQVKQSNNNKPLYITLICIGLVLCIILGWLLCAIFGGGRSIEERLLSEVLQVIDNDYYQKVSDAKLWKGIEDAGTALLQTAGDRYSRLMSPATHYSYRNPQSSMGSPNGVFGMTFQIVEGVGLYVASVTTNSNAYGVLEEGDLIVKLSDINDGQGVKIGDVSYNEVNVGDHSAFLIQQIVKDTDSASFSVLRNGEIFVCKIVRGIIDYVNTDYPFEFVEFYFGEDCTNVSLTHGTSGPQTSTKEHRLLNRLADIPNAGYVRIVEFMDTYTDSGKTTAADEFEKVMDLFKQRGLKYLILDLKGNPGGDVGYVSDIAGMLITDSKLSPVQQRNLRSDGELLITTLKSRGMGSWQYTAEARYEHYFGEATEKPSIVVWTDGGSASASELLTGALTDYGTAVQMGTTTYGKGIAQTIKELTDYKGTFVVDGEEVTYCWAVYFTVAEYFSPVTNTNIHGIGYTPDKAYDGLSTYDELWTATINYFKGVNSGSQGGTLA